MPKNTNFTTQDYGLANWLVFNRVELLGTIEYPNDTRKTFVFSPSTRLDELVEDWGEPTTLGVSENARICKKFFQAHSIVKKALKESLPINDY